MASVMWRYQPTQVRTSYSSRPTSPLASSKACSTCQRVPATSTTYCSVVLSGPKTKQHRLGDSTRLPEPARAAYSAHVGKA
jgi:hypothetical protein